MRKKSNIATDFSDIWSKRVRVRVKVRVRVEARVRVKFMGTF